MLTTGFQNYAGDNAPHPSEVCDDSCRASSARLNKSDFIVNYVWINKDVFTINDSDPSAPLCGIPLHYVDKAIANAKQYPDTQFQIWIDPQYLTDTPSEFFLQSHLYYNDCQNITVRDLNNIASYATDAFFNPENRNNIWHRVDLARLLALQDCLNHNEDKKAIYADFDIEDVFFGFKRLSRLVTNYGTAFGGEVKYKEAENSYFCFGDKNKLDSFTAKCFQDFDDSLSAQNRYLSRNGVFAAYARATVSLADALMVDSRTLIVRGTAPPCHTKIPKPESYTGLCI
jgi:hypothetical protein